MSTDDDTFTIFFRDGRVIEVAADFMEEFLGPEEKTVALYRGEPRNKGAHVACVIKSQVIAVIRGKVPQADRPQTIQT